MKTKIAVVLFLLLSIPLYASATVTVTPATGGSAISADATGGSYTALTGPIMAEGATGDIGGNGNLPDTIILNVPSGFVFDTGGTAPTVLVTRTAGNGSNNNNINGVASGTSVAITSRATTQIIFTVTGSTQGSVKNSLIWQNVRVRPSAGTPLASGNITESGTLSVTGVTGSTNLGTLTEVVGAKSQLVITTQPSSSATTATDFSTKPVVAVRDQFGNTVTSDNSSTITRTAVLSTQACGGTAGTGTLTSTPTTGAAVTAGSMTYTAMQYSAAESIKICFTSSGLTSALSNTITVSAAPTPTPTATPTDTPVPTGTPTPTTTDTPTPTPTFTEAPPVVTSSGGGGGGSASTPASIVFSGKAFLGATLGIYLMGQESGQALIGDEFKTQADGSFKKEITSPIEGKTLYGLLIKDQNGNIGKSKFFTYDIRYNTTIKQENILFAPIIKINKSAFVRKEFLSAFGYAAPSSKVELLVDGKVYADTQATDIGQYQIFADTNNMPLGIHTLRTRQIDTPSKTTSDVSEAKIIRMGIFSFSNIDFNQDGQINVSDWSIFLSQWSSSDITIRLADDINGDGKLDASDFSVFLTSFQLGLKH